MAGFESLIGGFAGGGAGGAGGSSNQTSSSAAATGGQSSITLGTVNIGASRAETVGKYAVAGILGVVVLLLYVSRGKR